VHDILVKLQLDWLKKSTLHWILFSFFLEPEGARSSYCNLLNKKWQKESLQKKEGNTQRGGGIKRQKEREKITKITNNTESMIDRYERADKNDELFSFQKFSRLPITSNL